MKNNSLFEKAISYHKKYNGKIEVLPKVSVKTREELSLAYTPGVAIPCLEIAKNNALLYDYTVKANSVFVVSDGSAVLGLGNIGHRASLPVMEGKALLFKVFGGIDAYPIIIASQNEDEIVSTVFQIADGVGGINLEDISAPRCFNIEEKLSNILDIPVFHDDQHGTSIVTLAGLINSLKLAGKEIDKIKIVINGSGAAGVAIARLLLKYGAKYLVVCDRKGAIYEGREEDMNDKKIELAKLTNPFRERGSLGEVIKDADVFIGVSVKGALSGEMVRKMADKPIVFAMANPDPEILPAEAYEAGAYIVATGRSDYPNQINNCLGFPGIFRGLLDVRAKKVTDDIKISAALSIANVISEDRIFKKREIIPSVYELKLHASVSEAVAMKAVETGIARVKVQKGEVFERCLKLLKRNKKRFF
jgi:malate dehydrogenase (oxaloacetate-decarboxylating)